MVFNGNTAGKTEHTIWKGIKNLAENWCQIVCGILFDLINSMTSSVCLVYMQLTRNESVPYYSVELRVQPNDTRLS